MIPLFCKYEIFVHQNVEARRFELKCIAIYIEPFIVLNGVDTSRLVPCRDECGGLVEGLKTKCWTTKYAYEHNGNLT